MIDLFDHSRRPDLEHIFQHGQEHQGFTDFRLNNFQKGDLERSVNGKLKVIREGF